MLSTFPQVEFTIFVLLLVGLTGCGETPQASPPSSDAEQAAAQVQLLKDLAELENDSKNIEPVQPVLTIETPAGWSTSDSRPLPAEDHGFTIGYDHETGLAVTLYQYTRGLHSIPNDLISQPVQEEMKQAKDGIQQIVQLGYYDSANELESKPVKLGDSQQQALWSEFQITEDNAQHFSEIYIWSYQNTLFKLRCTGSAANAAAQKAVLKTLLTAIGSASKP